jgi:hypothetical protein
MAGIQLLMISVTADPLNKASGVRLVISSMAVMGSTANSLLEGMTTAPLGQYCPWLGKGT